ncbi:hypothetical protein [Microbacterium alcoholitolerans]|uniref:hypothetical protein n=1 Tax=unclassified Microbacterium TaxID=2609290 RepID=UPI003D16A94D
MNTPRIAVISATPLAIEPAATAVRTAFPDGTVWNLLDDRLLADAQLDGGISERLAARMDRMIESALADGADGVLLTCSQYGSRAEVRDAVADGVAVLSADGPLFDEVVMMRPAKLLLVASLESAAADSGDRLLAAFETAGQSPELNRLVVPSAAKPLAVDELVSALLEAITAAPGDHDVVVLAQYSLAPAASALAERLQQPVLDGPAAAARRLAAAIPGDVA